MPIFLIITILLLYLLISIGVICALESCSVRDLSFLSEQNATLIINSAIPVGMVWPIFLLLLVVCGFIAMTKFVKNIASSK